MDRCFRAAGKLLNAVLQGLLSPQLSSLLFLVVGISMALTPWLAAGGQFLASKFEQHDVRSLLPVESEVLVHSHFCFSYIFVILTTEKSTASLPYSHPVKYVTNLPCRIQVFIKYLLVYVGVYVSPCIEAHLEAHV